MQMSCGDTVTVVCILIITCKYVNSIACSKRGKNIKMKKKNTKPT